MTALMRHTACLAAAAIGMTASGCLGGAAAAAAVDNLVRVQDPSAPAAPPPHHHLVLNTLDNIGMALETCWEGNLPPPDKARPGMMVTVMLTFNRTGALLGEPRFTFTTREASPETRALYQRAAAAAINTCTPLPFSPGLGNAVAGRPFTFSFVDRRNQKGA
jgi:hypothetical protein